MHDKIFVHKVKIYGDAGSLWRIPFCTIEEIMIDVVKFDREFWCTYALFDPFNEAIREMHFAKGH